MLDQVQQPQLPPDTIVVGRLLNLQEVKTICGISTSGVYKLMQRPDNPLPRSVRLGGKSVRWHSAEVREWMQSLPRSTMH